MPDARYLSAADALASWRDDLLAGTPPPLYPVGGGELARLEIGPGLVSLIGGAPGTGKTALVMQCVLDALRLTPTLRVVVCNVEMSPAVLLERQLARLSGIDLSLIRHRRLTAEHAERIAQGLATLEALGDRLGFVRSPFTLENVAASVDAFGAGLIVLDYLQRIAPPGEHGDKRGSVNATMDFLRQFADAEAAILAVAAVGRTKDSRGRSSYDAGGLGLASFKESGELEYGADSAYLLCPDARGGDGVALRCLKDRNGEPRDVALRFTRRLQRFDSPPAEKPSADQAKVQSALAAAWERTPPAVDGEGGEDAK
jgi:replicative DNA helicase